MIFLRMRQVDLQMLVQAPGWRRRCAFVEALLVVIFLHDLVHQVADPGADGLDHDLRAFFFEEAEHVEVAVALGGLRPEFAGDLDDGLHAGAVDAEWRRSGRALRRRAAMRSSPKSWLQEFAQVFRGAGEARLAEELGASLPSQRPGLLAAHHFVQHFHGLFEHAVGFAGVHFVGANLVGHVVDDVADVQRVQDGQEEVQVHFQAGFGFGLVQAAALLEQQHAELVEARSCAAPGDTRLRTCRSGRGRRRRR